MAQSNFLNTICGFQILKFQKFFEILESFGFQLRKDDLVKK